MQSFKGKVDAIVQASTMKEVVNQSFNLAEKRMLVFVVSSFVQVLIYLKIMKTEVYNLKNLFVYCR